MRNVVEDYRTTHTIFQPVILLFATRCVFMRIPIAIEIQTSTMKECETVGGMHTHLGSKSFECIGIFRVVHSPGLLVLSPARHPARALLLSKR